MGGGCGVVEYCCVSRSLAYSRILYEQMASNISTLTPMCCPKIFAAQRAGWAEYSWVFLRIWAVCVFAYSRFSQPRRKSVQPTIQFVS